MQKRGRRQTWHVFCRNGRQRECASGLQDRVQTNLFPFCNKITRLAGKPLWGEGVRGTAFLYSDALLNGILPSASFHRPTVTPCNSWGIWEETKALERPEKMGSLPVVSARHQGEGGAISVTTNTSCTARFKYSGVSSATTITGPRGGEWRHRRTVGGRGEEGGKAEGGVSQTQKRKRWPLKTHFCTRWAFLSQLQEPWATSSRHWNPQVMSWESLLAYQCLSATWFYWVCA